MKVLKFLLVLIVIFHMNIANSQVGVGTTSPDASSVLDVTSTDKGILIPRVSLPDITTTMLDGTNTAATGLLIYNTNISVIGGNGVGYYYFNGTLWVKLSTNASNVEKINDLLDGKSDNDGTQDGSSVFLGINAGLNDDSSDNRNIGIGFETLLGSTNGYYNSAIGYQSLYSNTTGSGNIANGYQTLFNNTIGNWNTANGNLALFSNLDGNNNTANGNESLYSNTNGFNNTANGYESMYSNTTGIDNTANGMQSLYSNTIGANNTANGLRAMYLNTEGNDNTAIGHRSLYSNTIGVYNTATGSHALYGNTIGYFNTANGYQSLISNTEGINNVASGSRSLFSNATGSDNVADGFSALYSNVNGNHNNAIGSFAQFFNVSGSHNLSIGYQSLLANASGSYNIGIGSNTGASNGTGSNNIYLGHSSGLPETGSNKLYIENSGANADNALIYGEFDTNILRTNSEFQIGNPTGTGYAFPTTDGSVNQILQTDGSGSLTWIDSSSISSEDHDFYEEGSTNAPNNINDDIYTQGNLAVGKNTADYALDIEEDSETRALNVAMTNNSNADNYSAYFENLSTGSGNHYGIKNNVSGSDEIYGIHTTLHAESLGTTLYGNFNKLGGAAFSSAGISYGVYNEFDAEPAGEKIGVQNQMNTYYLVPQTGLINNISGGSILKGVDNTILNSGGETYGVINNLTVGGNSSVYGVKNSISGGGFSYAYGSHNFIDPTYSGPQVGVYSEVTRTTGMSYAGYFRGKLAVGTTDFNSGSADFYVFPSSRGTANQIMQTDGTGNVSWVDTDVAISHSIDDLLDAKSDNDGTNNGSSIYLGVNAGLNDDSTNNHNVGLGFESLMSNIDGNYNSAIGHSSMKNNTSGINNSAYGFWSLFNNMSGNNNTAVGVAAGYSNIYGNRNVFLGNSSGSTSSFGDGNIYIGYSAGQSSAGDEKLYIENSNADADNALIYGEFDNNILRVNGELQLGDSLLNRYAMPTADGNLNQLLQTDGSGQLNWVDGTTIGTDNQTISYNATTGQLNIEDGNSVNLAIGDITAVTAGDGLIGGGTNGALTLDVVASNGLTTNANTIELGGNLIQATTITQGINNFVFDLNSTGDFIVQDNGTNHFEVRNTGLTYFGDDTYWNDGSTSGTTIARLYDSGNDGVFEIYKDALVQHQFHSAATSVVNELGQDFDFRIEGDNEQNLLYVDAGTDRLGVMENAPSFDVHLKQSSNTQGGAGGIGFESSLSTNDWKVYHSGTHFSFAENGVRRGYIEAGTGNYIPTSDRRLKKSITEVESILDKVNQLKAYRYLYKDQDLSAKKIIGFMAQEVQPLFPELVGQAEDGYFGLNYSGFGVLAVKAIQEQQELINTQKQQIEELQKSQDDMNAIIERLLKRVETLENQD